MKEQDLKHGAIKQSKAQIKWNRARRPHIDRHVARAGIPFDWNVGVDNTQGIIIKDQSGSDSCGGQAGAYFLGAKFKQDISAKSIYAPIAYPGGGTSVKSLENQICKIGANLESSVPSYTLLGGTNETWMTDLSYRNGTLNLDALTRAGWSAISVPRHAQSIAEAINQYGGVIWEIEGQDGNPPGWLSVTPVHPSSSNPNKPWNHFMCGLKAYLKNGIKTIRFPQSWGKNVGDNGYQDFDEKYIESGFILDCFTFVRTNTLTQQKTNILQAIIAWLKMMTS